MCANTKILIVTCYLLLQGLERCCAFALPSLCLRSSSLFRDGIWNGLGTDLKRRRSGLGTVSQRYHNGITTDSRRNCIGGITRAFFASLHRFSSILKARNYARCYVIETGSHLYSFLYFAHNSLIIFVLGDYGEQARLGQVTSNR